MGLKLTILSEQRAALGGRASIVFGVGGGSIGRAHDNDWVLPDPQRYLSAHHARVRFSDGAFHLFDTSSNGVYVNERVEALGRRGSYALRDGDRLHLGEYTVGVSVDTDTAEAPEASAVFPVTPAPAGPPAAAAAGDLGDEFSMGDLLPVPGAGGADGTGALTLTDDAPLLDFDRSEQQLRRAAAAAPAAGLPGEQRAAEAGSGLEAFARGAGIDPAALTAASPQRLLHLAGLMLREAMVGLKGLALAQREMRDRDRIAVGREDPQRIGLTGLPVEDLLQRLLQGHLRHELDAVQCLRETLTSTRRHDVAAARALRGALQEFLARLDPRELGPDGARAAGADELRALAERFLSLTGMADGEPPHLFAETYARLFAEEFRRGGGG